MKYWKDLAKHGRGGDTMMKKIDGDLAHVNAFEYEMSPEYIKEHGSGTINPVTGKKEYFDPFTAASLGLQGVSMLMGGFGAMGNKGDVAAARGAAEDMYQQQLGLFSEQRGLAEETAELGFEGAEIQATGAKRDLTRGYQTTMDTADYSAGKTNLVTSGMTPKLANVKEKFADDVTKIFDTLELKKKERDIQLTQAGATEKERQWGAESQLQSTYTQLANVPTTFLEGVFG